MSFFKAPKVDVDTPSERTKALGLAPQLASLSRADLETLTRWSNPRTVLAGGDIYLEDEKAESFSVLVSGIVAKKYSRDVAIKAPTLLGALPILRKNAAKRRRTAGLIAISDAVLVDVSYMALDRLAPEARDNVIDIIAEDALGLIEKLERQAHGGK